MQHSGIDFFPLYFLFLKFLLSLSLYFLLLCWDFYLFILADISIFLSQLFQTHL